MARVYPTDLTDAQWEVLRSLIPQQTGPGRPRRVSLRAGVNALLYLERTGCQWRMLPKEFPGWTTVRYYFDTWTRTGTRRRLNDALRAR